MKEYVIESGDLPPATAHAPLSRAKLVSSVYISVPASLTLPLLLPPPPPPPFQNFITIVLSLYIWSLNNPYCKWFEYFGLRLSLVCLKNLIQCNILKAWKWYLWLGRQGINPESYLEFLLFYISTRIFHHNCQMSEVLREPIEHQSYLLFACWWGSLITVLTLPGSREKTFEPFPFSP